MTAKLEQTPSVGMQTEEILVATMKWNFPAVVTGAMAGFVIGFMVGMGLREGFACVIGGALGAICGGWVGKQGGAVARWCTRTTAVVGGLSFAAGFIGPIVMQPDNPQGPLLGIFYIGPFGALAGAVLGALIGVVVRTNRGDVSAIVRHPIKPKTTHKSGDPDNERQTNGD